MKAAGSTPYYTDKIVKNQIDEVLEKCAKIFTNLGSTSTVTERMSAKQQEVELIKSVRHLDPELIKTLLNEE